MQQGNLKTFIFVESPKKIKVFEQALKGLFSGKKYKVLPTNGHVRQAKKKLLELCADIEIEWEELPHLRKTIEILKQLGFDNDSEIYVATDSDREGEAIMWHFGQAIKKHFSYEKEMFRVYCRELTNKTIVSSFTETVDKSLTMCRPLVDSYMSRVIIDMFIGFNGSSLLWKKLYGCRSLGRVQSVVLLKIYERELLIKDFVRADIYSIKAKVENTSGIVDSVYVDGKKIKPSEDKDSVTDLLSKMSSSKFNCIDKITREGKEERVFPLEIGSLSTKANSMFHLSVNETYRTCQMLYEGVIIDNEHTGLITYMRTDSTYISPEFTNEIKSHISNKYGNNYVNYNSKTERSNNLTQQEAHEAIRLTSFDINYEEVLKTLSKKDANIYKLIIYHTIAPFMNSPKYEIIDYVFESECKRFKVLFTQKKTIYKGFKKLGEELGLYENLDKELQDLSDIDSIKFELVESTTKAPERYSEGSLIEEIKKDGIGRPSTYNYIIQVIKNRDYSYTINNKFGITPKGIILVKFVKMFMSEFINCDFTSLLEKMLDQVTVGKQSKNDVLSKFLAAFQPVFEKVNEIGRIDILQKIEDEILSEGAAECTECSNRLKLRFFSSSPILVCSCTNKVELSSFGYKDPGIAEGVKEGYSKRKQVWTNVYSKNKNYSNSGTKSYSNASTGSSTSSSTSSTSSSTSTEGKSKRITKYVTADAKKKVEASKKTTTPKTAKSTKKPEK